MPTTMIKEEAHKIIDRQPAGAAWDDTNVLEIIEQGLNDSEAYRTKDVKEIRAKYGLPE